MIRQDDMTNQTEGAALAGGADGLDLFGSRLAALLADSGLLDQVVRSCRVVPSFRPRRLSPLRRWTDDAASGQPQRLAGFRAGGAGGGGPGFRGLGRSSACRVVLPRAGAPVASARRPVSAAACAPSFTWRDPVI